MTRPRGLLSGFGWSAAYMLISRGSTLASVPLVLHGLGTRLYGLWVLAGSLVMIQSLFDLGAASAMVRYVAVAAAAGSRESVLSITRRTLAFYAGLSLLVALPLWFMAGALVDVLPFVRAQDHAAGLIIVRWAAVAFALTNVVLVFASALQGINQVGASYRDQTVGWVLYLPVLAVGLALCPPAQAVGIAWGAGFGLQLLLLSRSLIVHLRRVPTGFSPVPPWRELLFFGGRWQISAWADFATFQLPRFLAGLGLSADDLLSIDVSIRAAQTAVAPVLAFYPVVLPQSAELLAREGIAGLRAFLQRYYWYGTVALVAGASVLIPLEVPALAAWTGRHTQTFNQMTVALILIGTTVHASTGLLTSAQLAQGNVRSVMRYKAGQLLAGVLLLSIAMPIGLWAVAIALAIALALPATIYNQRAARGLGLRSAVADRGLRLRLAGLALCTAGPAVVLVQLLERSIGPWELLLVSMAVAGSALAVSSRLILRQLTGQDQAPPVGSISPSLTAAADHLARN